nr:GerAB/ArcD/ProY family transporter [uncultured Bacillus sp.]
MKQQPGKLGIREYISILILTVGAKLAEDTPSILYSHVQNAAWMIPIISGAIFFVPFFLLIKTLAIYEDKNLFELIKQLLGKFAGFIICLYIFLVNSAAISFDSRTYSKVIRTYYFTTTPDIIIYGILMFISAYGAKKGIQHIGSVSYIVVFYVIFSFSLALILCIRDANISAIFPILGTGAPDISIASIRNLSLFADFFILCAIVPYISSFKDFQKGTWIAYLYIIFELSIAILVFLSLFDVTLSETEYPFHAAIRYISFGRFLSNVEILFLPIWLMAAFIRFSGFLYINALMFGYLFKIKDFEYLIPSLAIIYLFIGMIPETSMDVSLEFKEPIQFIAGSSYTLLCIILWLAALIKGEFKHAKNKTSV